jgi:hypothetical protein
MPAGPASLLLARSGEVKTEESSFRDRQLAQLLAGILDA